MYVRSLMGSQTVYTDFSFQICRCIAPHASHFRYTWKCLRSYVQLWLSRQRIVPLFGLDTGVRYACSSWLSPGEMTRKKWEDLPKSRYHEKRAIGVSKDYPPPLLAS
jgi:hypothetical protein